MARDERTPVGTRITVGVGLPKPSGSDIGFLAEGTEIDGLVVEDAIARGGFGTVYRARRVGSEERVALKLLHAHIAESERLRTRFALEIEAAKRLDHPGIARFLSQGVYMGTRPYFVMEYLEGLDLGRFIASTGPITPTRAMEIFEPLCEALAYAHDHRILHRDIKASNVFIARGENGPRVVLLDFGIAKSLDEADHSLTTTGHTIGTPGNMAPEQLRGLEASTRTDVYALGVVLYQMLTGIKPFSNSSPECQEHMHLYGARPRPSSMAADISPPVDRVVVCAMNREAEGRFSGPLEMAAALREAVSIERISALHACRKQVVVVEVRASSEKFADPDDTFLDYLDEVAAHCRRRLGAFGFDRLEMTGRTQLFARDFSPAAIVAIQEVSDLIETLREALSRKAEELGAVEVRFRVDVVDGDALHLIPRTVESTDSRVSTVRARVSGDVPPHPTSGNPEMRLGA